MSFGNSRFGLALFYNHFSPFMFLIGPFLYFYVRNTLKNQYRLKSQDLWHFIPATIAFVGTIPYYLQSFDKKLEIADQIIQNLDAIRKIDVNLFYTIEQSFALRTLLVLSYLLYCFYLLWRFRPSKIYRKQAEKKQYYIVFRWLLFLLSNMLFICVSFTILALNAATSIPSESIQDGYILYVMAGFSYCLLSFSLLLFPEILYGIPLIPNHPVNKRKKENTQKNITKIHKEDPLFELSNAIEKYLYDKKPFLKQDFSISTIALDLRVPQNKVAYCINHIMGTKFSKLKTKLRIAHALELLKSGSNSIVTIEAIGKQSGFKTRSYFYAEFRKEIGCTPSEYIQNLKM